MAMFREKKVYLMYYTKNYFLQPPNRKRYLKNSPPVAYWMDSGHRIQSNQNTHILFSRTL